jgi:hypothetical protein
MIDLPSLDDTRVAEYRLVADPRALAARDLFVAEGRLVVARLLPLSSRAGHRFAECVRSVLVTPAARADMEDVLNVHPDVPVYVVPQSTMNGLAGSTSTAGAWRSPRGRRCSRSIPGCSPRPGESWSSKA